LVTKGGRAKYYIVEVWRGRERTLEQLQKLERKEREKKIWQRTYAIRNQACTSVSRMIVGGWRWTERETQGNKAGKEVKEEEKQNDK